MDLRFRVPGFKVSDKAFSFEEIGFGESGGCSSQGP